MARRGNPFIERPRVVPRRTRYNHRFERRSKPPETLVMKPEKRGYCTQCGGVCEPYTSGCRTCFEAKAFVADQQRLRSASVVDAAGYDGWVFSDGHGYNEGYFYSLDELFEWCDDEGIEPPCYVHPCEPTAPPQVSVDYLLDCIADNEWEGFDAENDLVGVDELAKAVDAFNAKQRSQAWIWLSNKVIVLDEPRFEYLLSTDRNGLPDITYTRRAPCGKTTREMAEVREAK